MNLYKYRVEDAKGNEHDHLFDTIAEARTIAQEHNMRVMELEFEYSDSSLVEDYTNKNLECSCCSSEVAQEDEMTIDGETHCEECFDEATSA